MGDGKREVCCAELNESSWKLFFLDVSFALPGRPGIAGAFSRRPLANSGRPFCARGGP